jgi:DNA-binding PadR family transcriptional regulator
MMVLGLVVQQPDCAAGVARRLADQFASARFSRTSAHTNLPSLAESGYVRLIKPVGKSSLKRYEATEKGIAHLRGWLRSSGPSPVIRDALQGKLQFLELEELASVLRIVREDENACRSKYRIAHVRVLEEQEFRRHSKGGSFDGNAELEAIRSQDEANMWSLHAQRLTRLREALEDLAGKMSADRDAQSG